MVVLACLEISGGLLSAAVHLLVPAMFLAREDTPPALWSALADGRVIAGLVEALLGVLLLAIAILLLKKRPAATPLGKTWALASVLFGLACAAITPMSDPSPVLVLAVGPWLLVRASLAVAIFVWLHAAG